MTKPTKCHVHPRRLRSAWASAHRVLAVCLKKPWVLSYPLIAQRRLWSDWADAQADPSFCWAHRSFCWFCKAKAKPTELHVHQAMTRISLRSCTVWSNSVGSQGAHTSPRWQNTWPMTFALLTLRKQPFWKFYYPSDVFLLFYDAEKHLLRNKWSSGVFNQH